MFSYIKMMGEGIYHVIDLLTFSDPSGERPVHWQQHFLTKKTCPSSPSLIFHTQSSANCCYYLAHVWDKHSYQYLSDIRKDRSIQISLCQFIIFKTKVLCIMHHLIYLFFNFQCLSFLDNNYSSSVHAVIDRLNTAIYST